MPEAKRKSQPGREASQETPLEAAFRLVASLPVPVFFKSRDGRYLGVNRAWEQFFGMPRADFVGKTVADLYPQDPAIAERHARMDEELYAKGGGQSYEIPIKTRSGELRDALYYKSTFSGPDGAAAGLVGTIVGVIILNFIGDVVFLLKLPSYWQPVAIGLILVAVVVASAAADSLSARSAEGSA